MGCRFCTMTRSALNYLKETANERLQKLLERTGRSPEANRAAEPDPVRIEEPKPTGPSRKRKADPGNDGDQD